MIYNVVSGNYDYVASGTTDYYDNTFVGYGNTAFVTNGSGTTVTTTNDHFIGTGAVFRAGGTSVNDLVQTPSQGSASGDTAANQYVASSAGSPIVGKGTNESSLRSALADLCRSILPEQHIRGRREHRDHTIVAPMLYPQARPSSGPWDRGAYSYP